MTRDERIGVLQAVAAASLFSTGAILIRWAQEMSGSVGGRPRVFGRTTGCCMGRDMVEK